MIDVIADGILTHLKAAGDADVLGYRYAYTGPYPREWEEGLKSSAVRYPAAWCSFVRLTPQGSAKSSLQVEGLFELVLGAKSLRNVAASRQDARDGAEVGVTQMMLDAVGLLHTQALGLEIGALKITGGEMVNDLPPDLVAQGVSLFVLQMTTTFGIETNRPFFAPGAEFVGDFKTFNTRWLPPIGGDPVLETQLTLPTLEEA